MNNPALRKVIKNLAGGLFFLLLICCRASAEDPLERVGVDEHLGTKIPLDITFRDESDAPVLLADLVKGPTIILPVYYRCSNVCFTLQGHLANALQRLDWRPLDEYRVISVSFDDEETPEMAARARHVYLSAMKKPFPEDGWRFLTGDSASIRRLTDAAGYGFKRQRNEFAHPIATVVVSGDGTIVRYLYGVSILPKDLALALVEARSGVAGGSIHKLMDYCFSYDPVGRTYVFNLLKVSATAVILCTGGFLTFLLLNGRKKRQRSTEKS
jgi:protein SCO1/2